MWPRTLEERSRNRHTGFVCFMNRQDAEDAMEACSETDPFKVGRQLMMRWGKNVKKVADGIPIVKKGTGGIGAQIQTKTHTENRTAANDVKATLAADPSNTIRVIPPSDVRKLQLITMVASFIAKDGEQLERMLAQQEAGNPDFQFLTLSCDASEQTKQEKVFYKWRVYSLCQGDGFHTWRTEPFKMIYPNGCTWIPPPRDDEAAKQEAEETKQKEQEIQIQKQTRRLQSTTRSYMTGRQLEQARRGGADAGAKLSNVELAQFEKLFKEELCASRESICQAMAFCFEKSGAAKQLSCMLKELILNNVPSTSIETITARLFLISDILFNSQQPGIRNAFMYRDAIEQMSPEVFTSIGVFARENFGRMSTGRLASSINAIFSAWVNWGVFDHAFIDELQARFEDKEIVSTAVTESNDVLPITDDTELPNIDPSESTISDKPRGDWTAISTDDFRGSDGSIKVDDDADADGEHVESFDLSYTSGKLHAGNADDEDGEPLDDESIPQYQHSSKNLTSANGDDPHGKSFDEKAIDAISTDDVDGEEICDDPDGEPVDDDADGESVDGEPLREVFDSEPNDAPPNDLDGEMI